MKTSPYNENLELWIADAVKSVFFIHYDCYDCVHA